MKTIKEDLKHVLLTLIKEKKLKEEHVLTDGENVEIKLKDGLSVHVLNNSYYLKFGNNERLSLFNDRETMLNNLTILITLEHI